MDKSKKEIPNISIRGKRKRITLNRKQVVDKKNHPQGRKISNDLYKALSVLAKYFAKDFVKDLPEEKRDEIYIIYTEKFIRHFKEIDFLNIDIEVASSFNKKFTNDIIYKTIMNN